MTNQQIRQEIYDRIRAASRDEVILEEMQRMGFWQKSDTPDMPEQLIQHEAALHKELKMLTGKVRQYESQEAILKEMHRKRMQEKKAAREQTKQRNKQQRQDRAAYWKNLQESHLIYLGKGVSGGLNHTASDTAKLEQYGLPYFEDISSLATAMGIPLQTLRYLLFHREVSRQSHYFNFEIPKKSGGSRRISAPKKQLKQLQVWVLKNILSRMGATEEAHGFIRNRSIVTNARLHVGSDIIVNIDLKDFFPSIHFGRVKGLFCSLGYSEQQATVFALICTCAPAQEVEMDGVKYFVHQGRRILPQGSPASPAISNLIAYKLDKKIKGLTQLLGFAYSRYADDLSFSADKEQELQLPKLIGCLKAIVRSEGFEVHPNKTHIMRKGNRQEVTGIVVNEKPAVSRQKLHRFRALLHNLLMNGWKDQHWGQAPNLIHAVEGYIRFIKMVDTEKSEKFNRQLQAVIQRHGYPEIKENPISRTTAPLTTAPQDTGVLLPLRETAPVTADWWNIF